MFLFILEIAAQVSKTLYFSRNYASWLLLIKYNYTCNSWWFFNIAILHVIQLILNPSFISNLEQWLILQRWYLTNGICQTGIWQNVALWQHVVRDTTIVFDKLWQFTKQFFPHMKCDNFGYSTTCCIRINVRFDGHVAHFFWGSHKAC